MSRPIPQYLPRGTVVEAEFELEMSDPRYRQPDVIPDEERVRVARENVAKLVGKPSPYTGLTKEQIQQRWERRRGFK